MTTSTRFFPIVESAPRGLTAPTPLDREEARRLCQVTLAGAPARARSLLVEVDARGAHLIAAAGAEPIVIWTVCLDGLDEDRAIADALARAKLGFLRGWLSRGLVILGRPQSLPQARRQTSVLRALTECLGLAERAATAIVTAQAA
jgi:hypothetical protein